MAGWLLSKTCLQDIAERRKAQYAALVFDDAIIRNGLLGNGSEPSGGGLDLRAVAALVTAAAATAAGAQGSLGPLDFGSVSGQATAVALKLSPEIRVLRTVQNRFSGADIPVTLMHNASAQHALPSLFSGNINSESGCMTLQSSNVRGAASTLPFLPWWHLLHCCKIQCKTTFLQLS